MPVRPVCRLVPVLTALAATVALCAAAAPGSSVATAGGPTAGPVAPGAPLAPSSGAYRAEITRTTHGIPHVVADDWGSLGYGHGYAAAGTSACELLDTLVTGRGERSRWFGPDARYRDQVTLDATNLETDLFFTDLRDRRVVERLLRDPVRGPGPEARALARGYVAGLNRWLRDVGGPDGIGDRRCRGAGYARQATTLDLWYGVYAANLLASGGVLLPSVASATPPSPTDPGLPGLPLPEEPGFAEPPTGKDLPDAEELRRGLGKDAESPFGSNATAVGGDATKDRRGMVLGNPHFPWKGRYRFSQVQLTIPGAYDVAGASLIGSPVVNIGFTDDVAWSHTVSTAYRFTPYEYRLVPGAPTSYLGEDGVRELEEREVTVQVRRDGRLREVTRTLYRTDEGYVIDAPDLLMGWTPLSVFAFRDANAEHLRTLDAFLEMGRATSARDLLRRQDRTAGIPWVNTVVADRAGTVAYADNSVVPHVTDELVERCLTPTGVVLREVAGLPVLDGARAGGDCAWGSDEDAARPGILGPGRLPRTVGRDWVANANDSYWTPNATERLEGYDGIIGCERCERSLRTRTVFSYPARALEREDRIGLGRLASFEHANRLSAARLAREGGDLATTCALAGGGEACEVLARWSGRDDPEARGAHVFREFFTRLPDGPWTVPFDPERPLTTPRDLREADPQVVQAMRDALAYLEEEDIPLDARLDEVQGSADDGLGRSVGIGGGPGTTGNANVVDSGLGGALPGLPYPVRYGSSYIQAVGFDATGPRARTILTYGQSTDPASPWAGDQTRLFGKERWVSFPFTPAEIRRDRVSFRVVAGS